MNRHRIFEVKTMCMSRRGLFERLYEVHHGRDLLATLSFDGPFTGRATGLFAGESWMFIPVGFFSRRVTVRRSTSELDDAVFQNRRWSNGGTLSFPDGRTYSVTADRWQNGLQFVAEAGETVMTYRPKGMFNSAVDIEVMRPSADLPLMLLLGCYLFAVMQEESVSAAAATVAALA